MLLVNLPVADLSRFAIDWPVASSTDTDPDSFRKYRLPSCLATCHAFATRPFIGLNLPLALDAAPFPQSFA
jgi:hypothetical protein